MTQRASDILQADSAAATNVRGGLLRDKILSQVASKEKIDIAVIIKLSESIISSGNASNKKESIQLLSNILKTQTMDCMQQVSVWGRAVDDPDILLAKNVIELFDKYSDMLPRLEAVQFVERAMKRPELFEDAMKVIFNLGLSLTTKAKFKLSDDSLEILMNKVSTIIPSETNREKLQNILAILKNQALNHADMLVRISNEIADLFEKPDTNPELKRALLFPLQSMAHGIRPKLLDKMLVDNSLAFSFLDICELIKAGFEPSDTLYNQLLDVEDVQIHAQRVKAIFIAKENKKLADLKTFMRKLAESSEFSNSVEQRLEIIGKKVSPEIRSYYSDTLITQASRGTALLRDEVAYIKVAMQLQDDGKKVPPLTKRLISEPELSLDKSIFLLELFCDKEGEPENLWKHLSTANAKDKRQIVKDTTARLINSGKESCVREAFENLSKSSEAISSDVITNALSIVSCSAAIHQRSMTKAEADILIEISNRIDPKSQIDREYFLIAITEAIASQKLIQNLDDKIFSIMCGALSDAHTSFKIKSGICKSLNYLISMNPRKSLRQEVVSAISEQLGGAAPEMFAAIFQNISAIASTNSNIADLPLESLLLAIGENIEKFTNSPSNINLLTSSLEKLSDKMIQLPDSTFSKLIDLSISDQLSLSQRMRFLKLLYNFGSIKVFKSPEAPANLEKLSENLTRNLDIENVEEVFATLKILNLFIPSENLLSSIPKDSVEKIITTSLSSDNDELSPILSEASLLLSNLVILGYENDDVIEDLISEKFSYETVGEVMLLRNAMLFGGFKVSDETLYGLSDIVSTSSDSRLVAVSIITLMTGIEIRNASNAEAISAIRDDLDYKQIALDIESALELEDKALFPPINESLEILETKYGVKLYEKVIETDQVLEIDETIQAERAESDVAKPRTREELIHLLELANKSRPPILEKITLSELERKLGEIDRHFDFCKGWNQAEITSWASEKGKSATIEEIIAVADRANEIISEGHRLRETQKISAILALSSDDQGILEEIKTGEGKSTTISVIAIAKALKGNKVDIITSSPVLATRDAASKEGLYQLFGLSCDHNILHGYKKGIKDCYDADIVYGDAATFQFDHIRHSYKNFNTRGDRRFDSSFAIVDEVDSMLLDEKDKIAKIASHNPGMEYLTPLMSMMWGKVVSLYNEAKGEIVDIGAFKKEVAGFGKSLIDTGQVVVPKHLKAFAITQMDNWSDSAYKALNMKEQIDYVILQNDDGNIVISPVDYENTGITQVNTSWQNGLHQFLQMKHHLEIRPERLTSAYISNMSFFKLYGANLCGLTGTLGSPDSRDLLSRIYNVQAINIPTFIQSRMHIHEGIVADNEASWLESIKQRLIEEVDQNKRAALIVCDTIEASYKVASKVQESGIGRNIKLYTRSDTESLSDKVSAGDIIIATNLAGRGTDISTSKELEAAGGLYECTAFLPRNQRIADQAAGRTARQGKNGSSQLIINKEKEVAKYGGAEFTTTLEFEKVRDYQEKQSLSKVLNKKIPKLEFAQILFDEFSTLKQELAKISNEEHLKKNLEENWGIWYKANMEIDDDQFNEAEVRASFETFKSTVSAEYKKVRNPAHITEEAYMSIINYRPLASIASFEEAINIDPTFGFMAAYDMSYALVRGISGKRDEYDDGAPGKVSSKLGEAETHITSTHLPQIDKMEAALVPQEGSPLAEQIEAKRVLLQTQLAYVRESKAIASSITKDSKIVIAGTDPVEDAFPKTPIYDSILAETSQSGLHIFYHLGAKPKPKDNFGMAIGMVAATFAAPWTGGLSFSMLGGGALSAAASAGFSGIVSGFVGRMGASIYYNKGRLDKAWKESTSRASLRSLALDGLGTGMFAGAVKGLKIEGFKNLSQTQKVTRIAQHEAIKAGIGTTLGRGDFASNLRRGAGNTLMQSTSLHVKEGLADSGGFQRGVADTLVQTATGAAIGRDAVSAAIGAGTANLLGETNLQIGSVKLESFSSPAAAAAAAAMGKDEQQISDTISAAESARFTRGLVKDDIRERIAREGAASASNPAQGVAAGDVPAKDGSLTAEVMEEMASEELKQTSQVIKSRALSERGEARKAEVAKTKEEKAIFDRVVIEEVTKDTDQKIPITHEEREAMRSGVVLPSVHEKIARSLTQDMTSTEARIASGLTLAPLAGALAVSSEAGAAAASGIAGFAQKVAIRFKSMGKDPYSILQKKGRNSSIDRRAKSAASKEPLSKSLASQAQMGEKGVITHGAMIQKPLGDIKRILSQYGGRATDWVKKSSSSHKGSSLYKGNKIPQTETHWFENIRTGQRVEFKTIIK